MCCKKQRKKIKAGRGIIKRQGNQEDNRDDINVIRLKWSGNMPASANEIVYKKEISSVDGFRSCRGDLMVIPWPVDQQKIRALAPSGTKKVALVTVGRHP
jgi:hypothetical protein